MKTKSILKNVLQFITVLGLLPLFTMCEKQADTGIEIPDIDESYLLLANAQEVKVFSTDESYSLNFITNKDWEVSIVEGEWVSAPEGKGGMGSFEYTLAIEPNTSDESRNATVELVAGGQKRSVSIFQYAAGTDPILQNLTVPVSVDGNVTTGWWTGPAVKLTEQSILSEMARAFQLEESDIPTLILGRNSTPSEGFIAVGLMASDDSTISYGSTAGNGAAHGPCFYCSASGDLVGYGTTAILYVQYDAAGQQIKFHSFPNRTVVGQEYNVRPIFVYTLNGKQFYLKVDATVTIK